MELIKLPGKNRGSTYYTCTASRGFYFRINKRKNGKNFLVCVEKGCSVRATSDEVAFTTIGEGHNHLADVEKGNALLLQQSMVQAASTSSEDFKSIFVRESARSSVDAAGKLAFPTTANVMRRERRRVQPAMPTTLREFGDICKGSARFGQIDSDVFYRGAVGEGEFLSVLFLAEHLKHLLADAKEVHVDGTFKTRPKHPASSQLLTIMVVHYGYAFPCAFALMSSRKTEAYNIVFEKIKEIVPEFHPQLIMSDFEVSLVTSLGINFPQARKTGCFFHYCQALLRKARVLGMTELLKSNNNAKKAIKMLMALALLPANSIDEGVNHITSFLLRQNILENFRTLLRYHQRQWCEKVGANSLSVFNRTRRTNNDNESFHAMLQRLMRVRGPNVWEFTDGIRNISATTVRELRAFVDEGLQIRVLSKRKYRLNDSRIKEASTAFLNHKDVGRFLNGVSYSVERHFNSVIADDFDEELSEEFFLASLAGDVPAPYQFDNGDADDIAAEEEVAEETEQEVTEAANTAEVSGGSAVCMICQTAPPTTVLLPCRHFGLCDECCTENKRLHNTPTTPEEEAFDTVVDYSVCPLDRIPIVEYMNIVTT